VILIRYPGNARADLAQAVVKLVQEHEDSLPRAFVVVQPGYVRINRKSAKKLGNTWITDIRTDTIERRAPRYLRWGLARRSGGSEALREAGKRSNGREN
jgi:hypothetical protein